MKPNLQFDFLTDKENNTLTIVREFAANRQLVWDCHTKSELLDRWFAPKPFTTKTAVMNFSEGGHWHYAMIDPEGAEFWARLDYLTIQAIDSYSALDGFCDATGELNTNLPRSNWDVNFTDKGGNTIVQSIISYKSLADLETVINMGMQEGMTSTLECLDELLETLTKNTMISIETNINVAESKVWELYTTPEHILQWNTASEDWHTTAATNDLRVGVSFNSTMAAKDGSVSFDFAGIYDVVQKNQTIAYTMSDGRKTIVTFTKKGETTIVSIAFEAEIQNSVELQRAGWQAILDNFKKYAEANG